MLVKTTDDIIIAVLVCTTDDVIIILVLVRTTDDVIILVLVRATGDPACCDDVIAAVDYSGQATFEAGYLLYELALFRPPISGYPGELCAVTSLLCSPKSEGVWGMFTLWHNSEGHCTVFGGGEGGVCFLAYSARFHMTSSVYSCSLSLSVISVADRTSTAGPRYDVITQCQSNNHNQPTYAYLMTSLNVM